MKKKNEPSINQYLDPRLIRRLRIYIIVMLIMLVVIAFEVLESTFSIPLAIGGILIGLGVGTIVSRMYRLSWDEETSNVIGRIDWIGAVILVFYLIFIHQSISSGLLDARSSFVDYYLQYYGRYHAG